MQKSEFPKEISLALSGGAAKGAYQLGIIDTLQKRGIAIKAISGTSIGAVIGAALASGKRADEIFEIVSSKEYRKIFRPYMKKGALFRIDTDAVILRELISCESFEELKIPLTVCMTHTQMAKAVYRSRGDLWSAVLASSAISPLFPPVEIDGVVYSDGGLVDNFPVEQLENISYPIVGVNLYPNNKKIPTTIFGWLKKNLRIAWQHNNFEKERKCDYYFTNVKLDHIRAFSFFGIQKAYSLGKKDMEQFLASKHII